MQKQNHIVKESLHPHPASSSISSILSDSLNLVESKHESNSLSSSAVRSSSASSVLLDLRQQQINHVKQIESAEFLPLQSQLKRKSSELLHDQITKSEICSSDKLLSIVQHSKSNSAPPKQINKAKRLKMERGEAYKDRSLDRYASKTNRKLRIDKQKNIY